MVAPATTAMPDKPRARDPFDRERTDRGQIEAVILSKLGRFHQNPAAGRRAQPAVRAQFGDAGEHLVGAFHCFHRQHMLAGDYHRLADIERPGGAQIVEAKLHIVAIAFRRLHAAKRAVRN